MGHSVSTKWCTNQWCTLLQLTISQAAFLESNLYGTCLGCDHMCQQILAPKIKKWGIACSSSTQLNSMQTSYCWRLQTLSEVRLGRCEVHGPADVYNRLHNSRATTQPENFNVFSFFPFFLFRVKSGKIPEML